MRHPKYLLLQIRNPGDPMRENEVRCFARALKCPSDRIVPFDLLTGVPSRVQLDQADAVLIGGSGDYSVVTGGEWLPPALDVFRELHALAKPTFASCWGFQAFAVALGGEVVTDLSRAELGTLPFQLTDAGRSDPVFGPLGDSFHAPIGHQDIVDRLPVGAVLLCSTKKVVNQAFTFPNRPVYGTQFHPELEKSDLVQRAIQYPEYIERITGQRLSEFTDSLCETPAAAGLLARFASLVFG